MYGMVEIGARMRVRFSRRPKGNQTRSSVVSGPGHQVLGEAWTLLLASGSCDITVQGGLHRLLNLNRIERAMREMTRVVGSVGWIAIVEPRLTACLSFVQAICNQTLALQLSSKINALATMIDAERYTHITGGRHGTNNSDGTGMRVAVAGTTLVTLGVRRLVLLSLLYAGFGAALM